MVGAMRGRGAHKMGGSMHGRGMCGRGACVAGACMVGVAFMAGRHAWWGVCVAGRGDMHGRGMRGRRDGHCSGRYASYLNAFLFVLYFHPPTCIHTPKY